MRLLKASTLQFETFYVDVPPYAILSHSWGPAAEEATLQDLRDGTGNDKLGYLKIKACCAQALRDNLEYAWVDTCCIDKTNSVELQEAINSMFNWYRQSTVCYAYISDYDSISRNSEMMEASKWFTRGWTLQELIAPLKVVFYSRTWNFIGNKADLSDLISRRTGISLEVLLGQDLKLSSVAQRMSWAATRQTTRPEDIAYSLLGIFGVNIPLIYGEGGDEAFIRLQQAIIEKSDDHSLFAWKLQDYPFGHGLLARSPAQFRESSFIIQTLDSDPRTTFSITNRGLRIQLPLTCKLHGGDHIAMLRCQDSRNHRKVGIYVSIMDDGRFIRTKVDQFPDMPVFFEVTEKYRSPSEATLYVPQYYLVERPGERIFTFRAIETKLSGQGPGISSFDPTLALGAAMTLLPGPGSWAMFERGFRDLTHPYNFAVASPPGRNVGPGVIDIGLKVGGVAGLLFKATNTEFFRPRKARYVAIIFGVNCDNSTYSDIVEIHEEEHMHACDRAIATGCFTTWAKEVEDSEWFPEYLSDYLPRCSAKRMDTELFKWKFSIRLQDGKVVDNKVVSELSILHGPAK